LDFNSIAFIVVYPRALGDALLMKSNTDYKFDIVYRGRNVSVEIKNGRLHTTMCRGLMSEDMYEAFRYYLESEGFFVEKDKQKGIYDLF
jgi:trehalose/maltose hydrolase-like predicted phosphorylase